MEQFHRKASICCNRLIVCMHFFRVRFFNSFFVEVSPLLPFLAMAIVDICVLFETHANFQQVFMDSFITRMLN